MFHLIAIAALVLQVFPANAKIPGNLVVDPHVPDGATAIYLSLQLAERQGDPQNGSAARVDDVALAVSDEREARALLAAYTASHSPRGE